MSLVKQINDQIMEAMKQKNEVKLRALRSIKSAFLLAGTETGNKEISDEIAVKAIQKLAKQRRDSIEIFSQQNRNDLVEKETAELNILEAFLPEQMTEEEILKVLKEIIAQTGATGMKDMGKVMPVVLQKLAGKADGSQVASLLKQLLSA
jgi:uncharacterized protein YqeY